MSSVHFQTLLFHIVLHSHSPSFCCQRVVICSTSPALSLLFTCILKTLCVFCQLPLPSSWCVPSTMLFHGRCFHFSNSNISLSAYAQCFHDHQVEPCPSLYQHWHLVYLHIISAIIKYPVSSLSGTSGLAFWCSSASSWMFTVKTAIKWSFPPSRTLRAGCWRERKSDFFHKTYRRNPRVQWKSCWQSVVEMAHQLHDTTKLWRVIELLYPLSIYQYTTGGELQQPEGTLTVFYKGINAKRVIWSPTETFPSRRTTLRTL